MSWPEAGPFVAEEVGAEEVGDGDVHVGEEQFGGVVGAHADLEVDSPAIAE